MRTAQLLLLALLSTAASAQTFEQLGFLRLNDTTPRSTRAVALGGASDPLGDVDMAANPATLASVKRPLFLVEGVRSSIGAVYEDPVAQRWVWLGGTSLSHAAVALPFRGGAIGGYYASEPRLRGLDPGATSFGTTTYFPAPCIVSCFYSLGNATALDRRERRYGVTVAGERGAFAFGAGVEVQRVEESAELVRFTLSTPLAPPALTSRAERLFRGVDGRAVVPNVGVRWRVSPRLAVAAAYNGAGSFTRTTRACNVAEARAEWLTCTSSVMPIGSSVERLPNAIRAGAAFAVSDRLRLAAEAVRRNYSKLANDAYTLLGGYGDRLPYYDVTELHAGVEYKLASLPVALRAGWWHDPAHYNAVGLTPFGQTVRHTTFGAGIGSGATRLDLAYDYASLAMQRRAVVGLTFGL